MAKRYTLPKKLFDAHNHLPAGDDGTRMVAAMDEAGIETAVVMGVPFGTARDIAKVNALVVKANTSYPGRLIGGVYLDPRRGKREIDAMKAARKAGVRLVKLFPNLGYYPDDAKYRPFFDSVARLGMAVLSHCGWLLPQPGKDYAAYYSHPGRFEKVIRMHPETPFILAHMGGIAGFLETVMLTTRTPNTYVDCSPGQGLNVLEFAPKIAGTVPPGKLMWGSDSAYGGFPLERYRKALVKAGFGPHLRKIFYTNARNLFESIGAVKPKRKKRAKK